MDDLKTEERRLRFLRLLAKRPAVLRETGDPATKLLEFAGERSVRIAADDVDQMCRSGRVSERDRDGETELAITEAGRAAMRRRDAGGFAGQHRRLRAGQAELGGTVETVTVNDAESPLSGLARLRRPDGRPWLERAELAAGEKLRADFEQALLQPRVTASWDLSHRAKSGGGGNAAADLADRALAARDRVNAAIEAVGPDLGGALVDVCCYLKGLEQVERERLWPRRSAKLMLKTALAMLDRHYHPQPPKSRSRRRILHWATGDYRPALRP